ncbi:MAG: MBL fold metallo-hydrolase [Egibacteraceae bacterium]
MATEGRFVDGFALGVWQTNCYLLGDRELGRCVVVDPGQGGAEAVPPRLAERGVECEAILLTHGHLDHVWAVPELAEELDCPVLLHREDRWLWDDPAAGFGDLPPGTLEAQFGLRWDPSADRLEELADHQTLTFAGFRLEVRHTPGHTPGHCVFLWDEGDEPLLLSGDLLFAGSVGRTDFPRSSTEQQMASLERVVLPLPDETVVRPGHMQDTTVGRERATNPFLRQLA